jgi:outer membrane protein assembly factor BamB
VDARTGAERWHTALGADSGTSLAVADGRVYAATGDGVVHILDAADGEPLVRSPITDAVRFTSPPTVVRGVLLVGDAAGILHAVDPVAGMPLWNVDVHGYLSAPAVLDGWIWIGGDDGSLRALTAGVN